jgi:VanZ family protein
MHEVPESQKRSSRWRRYLPLVIWMGVIFFASTGEFSAANTNLLIKPVLRWFFPQLSNEQVASIHFFLRKCGHFSEYAILGLLAARAFIAASHITLRRHWFVDALLLICVYALSDEFHQRFVASRTASIYDCLIDISGGLFALLLVAAWRNRKQRRRPERNALPQEAA